MLARRIDWVKSLGGALIALLLVAGVSVTSFADLRIISKSDDEQSEVLVKDGRIISRTDPNTWFMIDCSLEEVTYVYHSRYWRGPIAELGAALEEQLAQVLNSSEADKPEVPAFLGALFGSQSSGKTQVRVTQLEDETVAGYRATQYRVETGDGSKWKTHELVSVSKDLLREIEAEVGDCTHVMMDFAQQMAALVPLNDAATVYSDPAYQALFKQGFPVRSVTKMTLFGIELEAETVVVEVSQAPLHDDDFTVPSRIRRVESLSTFFGD